MLVSQMRLFHARIKNKSLKLELRHANLSLSMPGQCAPTIKESLTYDVQECTHKTKAGQGKEERRHARARRQRQAGKEENRKKARAAGRSRNGGNRAAADRIR